MRKTVKVQLGGVNPTVKYDTEIDLAFGDMVIVEGASGAEWGIVISEPISSKGKPGNNMVLRIADQNDKTTIEKLREQAKHALKVAAEKIEKLNLEMKLINAYYTLDGNKVLIQFYSDNRVDFRQLVKDLAFALRTRIELKQVGSRDEAKIVGAMGPCGMQCCCERFLENFENITIKMAKTQDISLNPQKINGMCGRLLCCLAYENDYYQEIGEKMPKWGQEVTTPDGKGIAQDNNKLKQTVNVKFRDGDITTQKCFKMCDVSCKGGGCPKG